MMFRALLWKEIQEQWPIGASLVVLGSGVLVAMAAFTDPPVAEAARSDVLRSLGAGFLATLMLSVTAGMVCGGALFAAEREAGTIVFLESLPAYRWQLWTGKLLAGFGLTLIQIVLLLVAAGLLGLLPLPASALAVLVVSVLAFFWGTFGSTAARTTLGSIGFAIPFAVLTGLLVLVPLALLSRTAGTGTLRPVEGLVFVGVMAAVPLGLSFWLFTAPDRARSGVAAPIGPEGGRRQGTKFGLAALIWLTLRQLRTPLVALSVFAVVAGLTLLPQAVHTVLTWPAYALAAGVLAGVLALGEEQTRGSARFWSEQRLPLGRLWAVKLGLHAAFGLVLLLLLATPLILQNLLSRGFPSRGYSPLTPVFRSLLFDELGPIGWWYLLVPAVYGFAAGHLCGLLFRKLVVACGVGGIVGGLGSLAWGPSLLAGGLKAWQLLLPPALLLLTARILLRNWAAETLTTRRAVARLVVGSVACLAALGLGLGYRVLEIPEATDSLADIAYVGKLPPIDENPGWRLRTISERFASRAVQATGEGVPPQTGGLPSIRRVRPEERFDLVLRHGWPDDDTELGAWLDRMFQPSRDPTEPDWFAVVEEVTRQPLGVYEYPQLIGPSGPRDGALYNGLRMALTLLSRGLYRQAAGDPGEFVTRLGQALVIARTMQNGTVVAAYQTGAEVERLALLALDRWLERLTRDGPADRSQLLRAVTTLLEDKDPAGPFDPTPFILSERYVLREAMAGPSQWLPQILTPLGSSPDWVAAEVDLVVLAWAVPWERERTRRLLGLGYESSSQADFSRVIGRPGLSFLIRPRVTGELVVVDRNLRLLRRGAILKSALCLAHDEQGRYPDSLDGLVSAGYLRAVPLDPFDESRRFGYRISAGEVLRSTPDRRTGEPPPPSFRGVEWPVPPGQAIIWSVGGDRTDQGGTSVPLSSPAAFGGVDDFVFLVPRPRSQD